MDEEKGGYLLDELCAIRKAVTAMGAAAPTLRDQFAMAVLNGRLSDSSADMSREERVADAYRLRAERHVSVP